MEYTLENLEVYKLSENFSDEIWEIVGAWKFFEKDTIGKQLVRAADSVSANIAEGYGRYFYKESKQFYFFARGSLQETKSWLGKCLRRGLIENGKYEELLATAEMILLKLNAFIKFLSKSQKLTAKTN
jgi:four helix bundle protein